MPDVVDKLRVFSESLAKDLRQLFGDKKDGSTHRGPRLEDVLKARARVERLNAERMQKQGETTPAESSQ